MLILTLIGAVWIFSCVMAVALCVAARRGDERIAVALFPAAEVEVDVAFVATFAEPVAQAPVARPAVPHRSTF